jgi:cleavage and polyadenylation specificity factor subunit 1
MKETLHFTKLSNAHLAKNPDLAAEETADKVDETRFNPMRALTDIGGYSTVFLPGASPSFVLKSATSSVKVMPLRGAGVRGLSSFHTAGCDRGFIYVDVSGVCRVAQLPPSTDLTTIGMTVQRIPIGDDVSCVAYHPPKDVYVIGTSTHSAFQLPKDDDHHREWAKEELPGGFHPLIEQSTITLLSPLTWSPIQSIPLDQGEFITTIKTLNLEVSESTHVRKQLIVVGTGISKGEDLAIRGAIYVFDVIRVVPDPSRPETDRKLKLLAKEEIPRGAVTAISEIGTQGCMVVAQGQKLMVRGLKEDGTLLPVAFMDLQTVATDVKTLPGTGLYVVADALKGVWMCGYAEEPYRMLLFGKGRSDVRVVAAELLPVGGELFVVVVDEEAVVHVLQFDPERELSFTTINGSVR